MSSRLVASRASYRLIKLFKTELKSHGVNRKFISRPEAKSERSRELVAGSPGEGNGRVMVVEQ